MVNNLSVVGTDFDSRLFEGPRVQCALEAKQRLLDCDSLLLLQCLNGSRAFD